LRPRLCVVGIISDMGRKDHIGTDIMSKQFAALFADGQ